MTSSWLPVRQRLAMVAVKHHGLVLVCKDFSKILARITLIMQELQVKILCKLRILTQVKLVSNSHLRMTNYFQIRLMMMTFGISHQEKGIQINSNNNNSMEEIDHTELNISI